MYQIKKRQRHAIVFYSPTSHPAGRSHLSERQHRPHPARSSRTDSAAVSDERVLLPDRLSKHRRLLWAALSVQPVFARMLDRRLVAFPLTELSPLYRRLKIAFEASTRKKFDFNRRRLEFNSPWSRFACAAAVIRAVSIIRYTQMQQCDRIRSRLSFFFRRLNKIDQ